MKITITNGQTLWDQLKEKNIFVEKPCGGMGTCGKCRVEIAGIGNVRSCQFREPGEYEVTVSQNMEFDAVVEGKAGKLYLCEAEPDWDKAPVFAVDIGTTTVAVRLFFQGKQYTGSFTNPQRVYGADVMSRIRAASEGKCKEMQAALEAQLFGTVQSLCKEAAVSEVRSIVIAANTTMQHIFRGMSCEGLGKAPFVPVTLAMEQELREWEGKQYELTHFPGISAYIGADIVSGIFALDMLEEEEPVLLLDLGTNGEMALGCRRKLFTASAAAGPAFEGSELAGKLHASGIMRILCEMREKQVMDAYGTLCEEYFDTGYPFGSIYGKNSVRSEESSHYIDSVQQEVRITQEDIREIQMAKSAIRAGIEVLLGSYGISASEVKKVYLAGGMGYYIDAADAVGIGLLPQEFAQEKILCVGNSSLYGAIRYLKQNREQSQEQLRKICASAREITLANTARFQRLYLEYMNFGEEI